MAKFEGKAPEIEDMLNKVSEQMTGKPLVEGNCASCGGEAKEFRDALSRKEYRISKLCQACQDSVFGGEL